LEKGTTEKTILQTTEKKLGEDGSDVTSCDVEVRSRNEQRRTKKLSHR